LVGKPSTNAISIFEAVCSGLDWQQIERLAASEHHLRAEKGYDVLPTYQIFAAIGKVDKGRPRDANFLNYANRGSVAVAKRIRVLGVVAGLAAAQRAPDGRWDQYWPLLANEFERAVPVDALLLAEAQKAVKKASHGPSGLLGAIASGWIAGMCRRWSRAATGDIPKMLRAADAFLSDGRHLQYPARCAAAEFVGYRAPHWESYPKSGAITFAGSWLELLSHLIGQGTTSAYVPTWFEDGPRASDWHAAMFAGPLARMRRAERLRIELAPVVACGEIAKADAMASGAQSVAQQLAARLLEVHDDTTIRPALVAAWVRAVGPLPASLPGPGQPA